MKWIIKSGSSYFFSKNICYWKKCIIMYFPISIAHHQFRAGDIYYMLVFTSLSDFCNLHRSVSVCICQLLRTTKFISWQQNCVGTLLVKVFFNKLDEKSFWIGRFLFKAYRSSNWGPAFLIYHTCTQTVDYTFLKTSKSLIALLTDFKQAKLIGFIQVKYRHYKKI